VPPPSPNRHSCRVGLYRYPSFPSDLTNNFTCRYILFNQLRISKSELESKLGNGLKDRYPPPPLPPPSLPFLPSFSSFNLNSQISSRFSVLRELLKGLPYHDEAMTRWHPNWLLLVEMTVSSSIRIVTILKSITRNLWQIFAVHPFPFVHGIFNLEVLGIKSV
jgi:hypothetical protein